MTKLESAARQALRELETVNRIDGDNYAPSTRVAIAALRSALGESGDRRSPTFAFNTCLFRSTRGIDYDVDCTVVYQVHMDEDGENYPEIVEIRAEDGRQLPDHMIESLEIHAYDTACEHMETAEVPA